uniref:G protein-coupled receptor 179 n=1 Tax=Lepisosteus oculatus TaxID=7918 RepID=W5N8J0_LEPOC
MYQRAESTSQSGNGDLEGTSKTTGLPGVTWSVTEEPTARSILASTPTVSSGVTVPTHSRESERWDTDSWEAAETFLYSGDSSRLALANCTQRHRLQGLRGSPSASLQPFLHSALDTLTHAANFLNMIFQANDIRESSVREDIEWYHALVRSLLEGDPRIYRAVLTFDAQPTSSRPQLVLQATREPGPGDILLQDLSSAWEQLHTLANGSDWFTALKFAEGPPPASFLHKRILRNDLHTLDTPKWNRGDSYIMDHRHVHWAEAPFLECQAGKFVPGWMLSLSTSFYGLKPDLSPEFRGVIRVDVNLQSFDVDQCAVGEDWFSNTHQCNRTSMECQALTGQGFRLGQYQCRCREGYYSSTGQDSRGEEPGNSSRVSADGRPQMPVCLPCWPGCLRCEDGSPCSVQEDWLLRAAVLAVQAFFMLLIFISMLVAYEFRHSKRIRASGLLLLETILFGSLLLYFPVFILYFKPSTFRCILMRWVRLLGFAIVYGTVTLKMYSRVLKVFLSRTAQRVPYMTSVRVLRMLGVIVLPVTWFLAAWTASALQNMDRNVPMLVNSRTQEGLSFSVCDLDRWDYMMAVAELLFLCWGSFLCYAVHTVPSAFHEPRYMGIAIHNEMLLSAAFHLLRFIMPSLHPDWTLLLFFTHTHVTITVTLGLLFIPKFLHARRPLREEIAAEVYEDELDLRRSGSYLNSSITSAWSEHSLDPDDIRDELKKLYAQLEVHKTKKMTANNPHLQKKRSSRRGLGRSIMKRITEIPESMSRQCSREDKEGSWGGGGGSHPGSCKKKAFESSSSSMKVKEDSIKHRVFSLRKSHSTYDHVRDHRDHHPRSVDTKDPSLLDSLMRKKLAKKASERSDSESVDAAPLVCKSASAHNLTADKKLLQPKPTKLQKSLSVITGSRDRTHLLPSKTCSLEDTSQDLEGSNTQGRSLSDSGSALETSQLLRSEEILPRTVNALLKEKFDKAEVCPWEVEDQHPEGKTQKHVTLSPLEMSVPGRVRASQAKAKAKKSTEKKKEKKEEAGKSKEKGADSPAAPKTDPQANKCRQRTPPGGESEGRLQTNSKTVIAHPGDTQTARPAAPVHKVSPSDTEAGVQNMIGKPGESQDAVCSWESEEPGTSSHGTTNAEVCTQDTSADPSNLNKQETGVKNKSQFERQESSVKDVCPWDVDENKSFVVKQEAIKLSEVVCPWERVEPASMTTMRHKSKLAEVCPWETEEEKPSLQNQEREVSELRNLAGQHVPALMSKGQESTWADICPWDVQDEKPALQS